MFAVLQCVSIELLRPSGVRNDGCRFAHRCSTCCVVWARAAAHTEGNCRNVSFPTAVPGKNYIVHVCYSLHAHVRLDRQLTMYHPQPSDRTQDSVGTTCTHRISKSSRGGRAKSLLQSLKKSIDFRLKEPWRKARVQAIDELVTIGSRMHVGPWRTSSEALEQRHREPGSCGEIEALAKARSVPLSLPRPTPSSVTRKTTAPQAFDSFQ